MTISSAAGIVDLETEFLVCEKGETLTVNGARIMVRCHDDDDYRAEIVRNADSRRQTSSQEFVHQRHFGVQVN